MSCLNLRSDVLDDQVLDLPSYSWAYPLTWSRWRREDSVPLVRSNETTLHPYRWLFQASLIANNRAIEEWPYQRGLETPYSLCSWLSWPCDLCFTPGSRVQIRPKSHFLFFRPWWRSRPMSSRFECIPSQTFRSGLRTLFAMNWALVWYPDLLKNWSGWYHILNYLYTTSCTLIYPFLSQFPYRYFLCGVLCTSKHPWLARYNCMSAMPRQMVWAVSIVRIGLA